MKNQSSKGKIGFLSVVSMGIGGMVGGGIFAVLGLAVQLAHGATPIAFAIAGLVALLTAYSYAKLSVAYPSQGGTVEFLNQAFGEGIITGGLNVLLWLSYVVMLSLYAYAFGSYGASFFPAAAQPFWRHILITVVVLLLAGLNLLGAAAVGEAEEWIVAIKLIILTLFVVAGLWTINAPRLAPASWVSPLQMISGGMIIFLAYEGFELIANAAADVKDYRRTLPRAYYTSVVLVIILYVLVAAVTVGNLPLAEIARARDYALAASAKPFLGDFGFVLIAIAALLSTGSAINATLYGASRVSYIIAKDGELPRELERKIWKQPAEGLLITSVLTLLVANLFDLSSISVMGSAGFLLIFAAVNAANVRLHHQTLSRRWISILGAAGCLVALGVLVCQTAASAPREILVLVLMVGLAFLIEAVYRASTGRAIKCPLRNRKTETS
ncbi:MAG TPA: APC family permease [Terriglobia bacterium]|nr:APC family permease [Terriglobia bacterium]